MFEFSPLFVSSEKININKGGCKVLEFCRDKNGDHYFLVLYFICAYKCCNGLEGKIATLISWFWYLLDRSESRLPRRGRTPGGCRGSWRLLFNLFKY